MTAPRVPEGSGRAIYALLLLSLITILNYYDRNLISIIVPDLKRDLQLSDSQIGLLSGLAFAVVYSISAVPIARYADRGRRVRVLAASATVWSIMSALCGAATGFGSLIAARFGVGLGEAGGLPTTHAIVAETASPRWRGTALSIIAIAGGVGLFLALGGGGYMAQHHGWRSAFLVGAAPGLVLALLLIFTVPEPRKSDELPSGPHGATLQASLKELAGRRAYVWSCLGMAIAGLGAFGAAAWTPTYFMRHYGLSSGFVGASYSAIAGPATILGILMGGFLADRLSRYDRRAPFFLLAAAYGFSGPISIGLLSINNFRTAMLFLFPTMLVGIMGTGPTYTVIQALSGPRLRAVGAAVFLLVVNLIGQGFAPLVIGWLSDALTPNYGRDGLRFALMIGASTYTLGGLCFLVAARTARADMIRASIA